MRNASAWGVLLMLRASKEGRIVAHRRRLDPVEEALQREMVVADAEALTLLELLDEAQRSRASDIVKAVTFASSLLSLSACAGALVALHRFVIPRAEPKPALLSKDASMRQPASQQPRPLQLGESDTLQIALVAAVAAAMLDNSFGAGNQWDLLQSVKEDAKTEQDEASGVSGAHHPRRRFRRDLLWPLATAAAALLMARLLPVLATEFAARRVDGQSELLFSDRIVDRYASRAGFDSTSGIN
ncbi:unnamed protein product [Phaeothamnion confervicola]